MPARGQSGSLRARQRASEPSRTSARAWGVEAAANEDTRKLGAASAAVIVVAAAGAVRVAVAVPVAAVAVVLAAGPLPMAHRRRRQEGGGDGAATTKPRTHRVARTSRTSPRGDPITGSPPPWSDRAQDMWPSPNAPQCWWQRRARARRGSGRRAEARRGPHRAAAGRAERGEANATPPVPLAAAYLIAPVTSASSGATSTAPALEQHGPSRLRMWSGTPALSAFPNTSGQIRHLEPE